MTGHGDWLVAALSLASCWLMGSKRRPAWLLAVLTNLVGAAFFAQQGLDGLVALEAAFVILNARGWWRLRPDEQPAPPPMPASRLAELIGPYRAPHPQETAPR